MKHKVKVTVLDKKLYPELQHKFCTVPNLGACPCYNIGDEFIFYRDGDKDDFWHLGLNTLRLQGTPMKLQAVLKCRFAQKHGMLFHAIFMQDCRAVP